MAWRRSTWGHHNKYFVNQLKCRGAKTPCDLQTENLQRECLYDSLNLQLKGLEGKKEIEKSEVSVIPGLEGASHSIFSPVAACKGTYSLEEDAGCL